MTIVRASATTIELNPASIQAIVTSPPYWGKRVYGDDPAETGNGQSLTEYARELTVAARNWRPALNDDGVLWMNLGDTYAGSGGAGGDHISGSKKHMAKYRQGCPEVTLPKQAEPSLLDDSGQWGVGRFELQGGQLCMVPFIVAQHLQGDGWLLRSMIVWDRGNPRPEHLAHVKRPGDGQTEMILMLTKRKDIKFHPDRLVERGNVWRFRAGSSVGAGGRGGHVAPFPDELPRRCIEASTDPGDLVFDPYAGTGTTCRVAEELGRRAFGCDLYAGDVDRGFA